MKFHPCWPHAPPQEKCFWPPLGKVHYCPPHWKKFPSFIDSIHFFGETSVRKFFKVFQVLKNLNSLGSTVFALEVYPFAKNQFLPYKLTSSFSTSGISLIFTVCTTFLKLKHGQKVYKHTTSKTIFRLTWFVFYKQNIIFHKSIRLFQLILFRANMSVRSSLLAKIMHLFISCKTVLSFIVHKHKRHARFS